jgi:hypothetical protein
MILSVTGNLEFFICSECGERWVGQSGEPRTQQWLKAHDGPHRELFGYKTTEMDNAPKGFDRSGAFG